VPSSISDTVPTHCRVTFANVLSRHGARDPTASKTIVYADLLSNLTANVTSFTGKYEFLADYEYTLGADMLTTFGQQQMINSGIKFYERYKDLAVSATPFVRSASEQRVVESAVNFTSGFHEALIQDNKDVKDSYPYPVVIVYEANGSNNTLSHGLCTAFEKGPASKTGDDAQSKWIDVFVPPIRKRLNADLPGAQLSKNDIISLMDLCPFNTVASPIGALSPFCNLFTTEEWQEYDYYESLGKWYGYGSGNYFGATNGVGFVNELIARMTNEPVKDHTSTNSTLDQNPSTFPVDKAYTLFADFSHDNDITGILASLGLYSSTRPLSNTTFEPTQQTNGYSASWTVPFAARVYFEKLQCSKYGGDMSREHSREEKVRVIVNDRVIPLPFCGADGDGMCDLSKFIDGLGFAQSGGRWSECFE
jgi:hypothetical protein